MERLDPPLSDLRGRAVRDGLEAWGARELTDPALRPVARRVASHDGLLSRLDAQSAVDEAMEVIQAIEPRPVNVRLLRAPAAKPPRRPSLCAIEAEAPEAASRPRR